MAVHQALGAFETRKKELVKKELDRLQEATNLANATMSSMNLPAALEVTKGNEIPQSLKEKSQAVINAGKYFDILLTGLSNELLFIIIRQGTNYKTVTCQS